MDNGSAFHSRHLALVCDKHGDEKRKVQQDRTVSLRGVAYEVDAALVGETVTRRYDPARLTRGVQVVCPGRPVTTAKPVDAYANCFVRRDHGTKRLTADTPPSAPPPGLPLRKLEEDSDDVPQTLRPHPPPLRA